ncbi:hypothetical protein GI582_05925 [Sulfitobacter sp. BDSS02]|nr:hypothetical protein [Sulfitobacter sp. BDSS02]MBR9848576.1 transposase family protein [Paracoccaceae bacterium]
MPVWRRKSADRVTMHSDQGSQFTSWEWQMFVHQHDLEPGFLVFASKYLSVLHELAGELL